MRTPLALLLLALPLSAAPVPKALKKNANPLAGEWVVVERYIDDRRLPLTDDIRWTIDGEKLAVRGTRQEVPDGFMDDCTRTVTKPEGGEADAYDYTILFNDGLAPSRRPARVELAGDRFTLCMTSRSDGPRPADCTPANGTITYVLKRADAK
jgi:hypothetical protein